TRAHSCPWSGAESSGAGQRRDKRLHRIVLRLLCEFGGWSRIRQSKTLLEPTQILRHLCGGTLSDRPVPIRSLSGDCRKTRRRGMRNCGPRKVEIVALAPLMLCSDLDHTTTQCGAAHAREKLASAAVIQAGLSYQPHSLPSLGVFGVEK